MVLTHTKTENFLFQKVIVSSWYIQHEVGKSIISRMKIAPIFLRRETPWKGLSVLRKAIACSFLHIWSNLPTVALADTSKSSKCSLLFIAYGCKNKNSKKQITYLKNWMLLLNILKLSYNACSYRSRACTSLETGVFWTADHVVNARIFKQIIPFYSALG